MFELEEVTNYPDYLFLKITTMLQSTSFIIKLNKIVQ